MIPPRRSGLAALGLSSLVVLVGCTGAEQGSPSDGQLEPAAATLEVLASVYPLQYVAERVGGDVVTVEPITAPGAEPHDVELSPRQLRTVGEADVVLYLAGFQPAVDEAVAAREPVHVLDAGQAADLVARSDEDDHAHAHDDDHDGHDHGEDALDPHFWLDPVRLAAVGQEVARVLGEASPADAGTFQDRADALGADLRALDEELAAGLADCAGRVVVTGHAAFGYLTDRYDLEQVGIAGLDPDTEPSPARLREIRAVVEEHDVRTIFAEGTVSSQVMQTLADDLGVATAVLDPVERLADEATDYRDVMAANLEALRAGLGCA